MNDQIIETQMQQLWQEFKAQCTSPDGLPSFEEYAVHEIVRLRAELAALKAERDKLRAALEAVRDFKRYGLVLHPGFNVAEELQAQIADMKQIARAALDEGGA